MAYNTYFILALFHIENSFFVFCCWRRANTITLLSNVEDGIARFGRVCRRDFKALNLFMKETKLYIFTTSVDPNPYINAIAHCSANYKQFNEFILIGITEDRGKIKAKKMT
jgi:hypothetical protein